MPAPGPAWDLISGLTPSLLFRAIVSWPHLHNIHEPIHHISPRTRSPPARSPNFASRNEKALQPKRRFSFFQHHPSPPVPHTKRRLCQNRQDSLSTLHSSPPLSTRISLSLSTKKVTALCGLDSKFHRFHTLDVAL